MDLDEIIYSHFEIICMSGTNDNIKKFISKYNIDINHNDGYYLELIVERNDLELFQMIYDLGAVISLNNYGVLRSASHNGNLELVKYIISKGGDYNVLFGTTALTNHKHIFNYITSLLKK
jgi:hypothetical protein